MRDGREVVLEARPGRQPGADERVPA
jgi:hypothetical protein